MATEFAREGVETVIENGKSEDLPTPSPAHRAGVPICMEDLNRGVSNDDIMKPRGPEKKPALLESL